jgi:uncharacterized membrane protein YphA (DoxX/SURF4 family)
MGLRERIGLNFPPVLLRLMLAIIFIWLGLGKIMGQVDFAGERAAALMNMGVVVPPSPDAAHEFAEPVRAARVYNLALTIRAASQPGRTAEGEESIRLWPAPLGERRLPVYQAWLVAFTEIIGGVGLLLGLFTRFWAASLAGVMLGAIWLTEIGVAVQAGQTTLGFLPLYETFAPQPWQRLMFQFALLMSLLALAFLGPGRASLDHALLGPLHDDDDED